MGIANGNYILPGYRLARVTGAENGSPGDGWKFFSFFYQILAHTDVVISNKELNNRSKFILFNLL